MLILSLKFDKKLLQGVVSYKCEIYPKWQKKSYLMHLQMVKNKTTSRFMMSKRRLQARQNFFQINVFF